MSNELAIYKSQDGEDITLTADNVREYLCKDATDKELAVFAAQAKMFQANPWAHEIYLVKYGGKPASTILSYHTFNRIASAQKDYNGIESGVIVFNQKTNKIEHNDGAAFFPQIGQVLIGGWAKVYRKGIEHPFSVSINLADFDKGTANWKSMKAFMIEKVAKGQAWRLAYPSMFHNVYLDSEIEKPTKKETIVEVEPNAGEVIEAEIVLEADEINSNGTFDENTGTQSTGASMGAKQALWTACKRWAEYTGGDAKRTSDGIMKRPDYEDTDEYLYSVAAELNGEIDAQTVEQTELL